MAVIPGEKIIPADLIALASTANAKSSLAKTVTPLYTDGQGQPYGHKRFGGVCVNPLHPGSGYVVGDILSLGFGSQFGVVAVSTDGAVRGIRIVDFGAGQHNDPTWNGTTGTQIANSGGSGTGCQLSYSSFAQYGPTVDYAFPDSKSSDGTVTGYYLVAGGVGYLAGDILGIQEQSGTVLHVDSVDDQGKILAFATIAVTTSTVIPQSVHNMSGTGGTGSGAKFGGFFTMAFSPHWLTELNRLRSDIMACGKVDNSATISGPWPVTGLANSYNTDVEDAEFYYEDNGTPQSVSVQSTSLYGFCNETLANIAAGNLSVENKYSSYSIDIVIGGDKNVILNGFLELDIYNRTSMVAGLAVSGSFPGLAFECGLIDLTGTMFTPLTPSAVNGQTNRYISMVKNQIISPGTYKILISLTNGYSTYNGFSPPDWRPTIGMGLTAAYSATSSVAAAAIHSTSPVRKITCPQTPAAAFPFGIWVKTVEGGMWYSSYARKRYITEYPDPDRVYGTGKAVVFWQSGRVSLTSSCNGFFTSKTAAVSRLNCVDSTKMPWNLLRTKYGTLNSEATNPCLLGNLAPDSPANTARISNSYNQALPVESQIEPPTWVASRFFTVGFSIMDSNGNLQVVVTAGTSDATAPDWATTENMNTSDGSITWRCRRVLAAAIGNNWTAAAEHGLGWAITDSHGHTQVCVVAGVTDNAPPAWGTQAGSKTPDGTIIWEMRSRIVPAPHRQTCVPRYPVYWASESDLRLKPPTSSSGLTIWGAYNQWQRNVYSNPNFNFGWQQDNYAKGWWIYRVSINRCLLSSTQVAVTIGCMRNGAFVAFGTWDTGQTIRVLWPIFTSDALVYQCAERVDIQAVAIASGGTGVQVGTIASGPPFCATFVSDTSALLSLIP